MRNAEWRGMRTRTKGVAFGVGMALVVGACGGAEVPGETSAEAHRSAEAAEVLGEPVRGGEITVGLDSETDSWLPSHGTIVNSGLNVAHAIFDPLVVMGEDGVARPNLAASLDHNEDLTEWTVVLRPDLTFHDGTDLDANILKAIFDLYTKTGPNTAGSLAEVREVRVDDVLTATYVLDRPNAAFPAVLQGPAGWPFSVAAAVAAGDDAGLRPAGTGAFKLDSWDADDKLVVVRNEDYWRAGLPYLDKVTFRPIPDETTRVETFLAGGLDAMISLRGNTIKQVLDAEDSGLVAHMTVGDDAGVSYMNVLEPPFDDLRIRRAYAHALDQRLTAEILGDDGLVDGATQFFGKESPWYSEKVAAARPQHDPAMAKKLVAEYVSDPARSDGLPVGEPPVLRYGCLPEPTLLEIAQSVQMSARAAGFDVELSARDQAEHVGLTIGGATTDPPYKGEFMVNCFRILSAGDPAGTFASAFGPPETQAGNYSNFWTPDLHELITELQQTVEFRERYALVEQIGMVINENVPMSYGTSTPVMIGGRQALKNIGGWTAPDGARGDGITFGSTRWSEVWLEG
jgi:peptide/nickel transport system substrate-binding protein